MSIFTTEEIRQRFTRELTEDEERLLPVYISDTESLISYEFYLRNRDLEEEIENKPSYFKDLVRITLYGVINRGMQFANQEGVRTLSSTTGSESDLVTYRDIPGVSFAGLVLTNEDKLRLGLFETNLKPTGARSFPGSMKWMEAGVAKRRKGIY